MKRFIAFITILGMLLTFNVEVFALEKESNSVLLSVERQKENADGTLSVSFSLKDTRNNISKIYNIECIDVQRNESILKEQIDDNEFIIKNLENDEEYKIIVTPILEGKMDSDRELQYFYNNFLARQNDNLLEPLKDGEEPVEPEPTPTPTPEPTPTPTPAPTPAPIPIPGKVKELKAHPGYKSITLEWTKLAGVEYNIYRSTKKGEKGTLLKKRYDKREFRDTRVSKNKNYYYRVYAYYPKYKTTSQSSAVVEAKSVRQMYVKVTFRHSVKLKTHDSKKRKYTTFHSGQTVTTEGFGGGKYKFYYHGRLYYTSYTRMCNARADYLRKKNYSTKTAENFVNESKIGSKTKHLIWVSTYTQHIYFFKGKRGHWKLMKRKGKPAHWEVSTGKAASPTPIGFHKKIFDKLRRHSGIDYWNCFQTMNSIHGKRASYKIGYPASHGCVRNYNENAEWIYYTMPTNTAVITY